MRSDYVLQYSMYIEKEISSFDFDRWSEMTHASNCSVSC